MVGGGSSQERLLAGAPLGLSVRGRRGVVGGGLVGWGESRWGGGEPASFSGRSSFRSQEGVSYSSPWGCNVRIGDGRRERLEGEIPYFL